jgi:hypothetical protein
LSAFLVEDGALMIVASPIVPVATFRRFRAKLDKKLVDHSSGEPEFVEDALHCNLYGLVVGVDGFWVVCAAGRAE